MYHSEEHLDEEREKGGLSRPALHGDPGDPALHGRPPEAPPPALVCVCVTLLLKGFTISWTITAFVPPVLFPVLPL